MMEFLSLVCAGRFKPVSNRTLRPSYYEVMRTLVALVIIVLHMLYTVAYMKIALLWSFFTDHSAALKAA